MRARLCLATPALLAVLGGCATSNARRAEAPTAAPPAGPTEVVMEPTKVVAAPATPDALSVYDAATLMARGNEFLDNGYPEDAARYFERVLKEFPQSEQVPRAHYNLGTALMQREDGEGALAQFDAYLSIVTDPADRLDGQFKRGAALAMLKRYAEVVELFDALVGEAGLSDEDAVEAYTDAGIGHFMLGDRATAEHRFRQAVKLHQKVSKESRVGGYFHAQSLFYLAEIERMDFRDVKLTMPAKGKEEEMAAQLERKCERLLSAQYKFLQVIRTGDARWAGAAGYKVGSMYEDLHDEMLGLPAPAHMTDDQKDIYRREMRRRVSVLIRKAIQTYESTVDMARRTGTATLWVEKTEKSLARMQQLLADSERDTDQAG